MASSSMLVLKKGPPDWRGQLLLSGPCLKRNAEKKSDAPDVDVWLQACVYFLREGGVWESGPAGEALIGVSGTVGDSTAPASFTT